MMQLYNVQSHACSVIYYCNGTRRVAVRTGSRVNYLMGDHLGSTSVVTDASGAVAAEMKYKPFGEVRADSGMNQTGYTFTGQYSQVDDFGLMFYNARWYDPLLSHFASADTLIPGVDNPLAWNRYAYTLYNPIRYTDPSGHMVACDKDDWACQFHWNIPVVEEEPYTPGPLDPIIEFVVTSAIEPLDWMNMADACMHGECSPWFLLALVPIIPGGTGDDIGDGLIRLVRKDQIGTSQPFKLRKGEDGLSVFEGVSPEEVLDSFPGNDVPNTTVIIPKDKLPLGAQIISKLDPDLPERLSEAHRILIRPDGWSIDRFAKAIKEILGWE